MSTTRRFYRWFSASRTLMPKLPQLHQHGTEHSQSLSAASWLKRACGLTLYRATSLKKWSSPLRSSVASHLEVSPKKFANFSSKSCQIGILKASIASTSGLKMSPSSSKSRPLDYNIQNPAILIYKMSTSSASQKTFASSFRKCEKSITRTATYWTTLGSKSWKKRAFWPRVAQRRNLVLMRNRCSRINLWSTLERPPIYAANLKRNR